MLKIGDFLRMSAPSFIYAVPSWLFCFGGWLLLWLGFGLISLVVLEVLCVVLAWRFYSTAVIDFRNEAAYNRKQGCSGLGDPVRITLSGPNFAIITLCFAA